jgi:hypothetical protein
VSAGKEYTLIFDSTPTITHNATSLIMPGAANMTMAAGNVLKFRSEGSGKWRCLGYIASASATRSILGVVIGADVQAYNSYLTGINQGLMATSAPSFAQLTITASSLTTGNIVLASAGRAISMADTSAININSKSAVYGSGSSVYFGWGFDGVHMKIGGVAYTLTVDGSGFVKATAD